MKHFQEITDEVFGAPYRYRTLRTLFDPGSSEWDNTTFDKKIEILKKLLDSKKITLEDILMGYKHFYRFELANKRHVLDSLTDGLAILLSNTLQQK